MEANAPADLPITDAELVDRWVSEIREQLSQSLTKYIDGPLPNDATDKYWLRLRDGDRWYRDKEGLSDKDRERLFYLRRAAIDLTAFEQQAEHFGSDRCRLPALFGCALRIGQFVERAEVVVRLDKCKGRESILTDDQKSNMRYRYKELLEAGHTPNDAVETAKDEFNSDSANRKQDRKQVSKTTAERVVGIRQK